MEIHSGHIMAYIEHLKKQGLTVTLHGDAINSSILKMYNYHQNPYCHYVKTVWGKWEECIKRQERVLCKCADGSFFGCCYAGVGEFVYPVKNGNRIICFVSVSGYNCVQSNEKSKHFASKNQIDIGELSALLNRHLKLDIPQKSEVDAIIEPLVFMLASYFESNCAAESTEAELYHKMLRYIAENCHSKITMRDLSLCFNYSVSTLSHLFLKKSGKSLPQYIDDLRMDEAKWHLVNSQADIAEIAYFLGYGSSNYFSTVFKKKNGTSPKEYRKQNKKG